MLMQKVYQIQQLEIKRLLLTWIETLQHQQEETNRKERKAQEELFANQQFERAERDAAAIYKVDLGSNKTNQNFHDYLFGMKEQSYKIRTLQREGKISSSEAAQAIAELNQKHARDGLIVADS